MKCFRGSALFCHLCPPPLLMVWTLEEEICGNFYLENWNNTSAPSAGNVVWWWDFIKTVLLCRIKLLLPVRIPRFFAFACRFKHKFSGCSSFYLKNPVSSWNIARYCTHVHRVKNCVFREMHVISALSHFIQNMLILFNWTFLYKQSYIYILV